MAPIGGTDMEVGVLFADLRGFTSWCEDQPPEAVARALNRFYAVTTAVIIPNPTGWSTSSWRRSDGLVPHHFRSLGDRTCEVMLNAAEEIVRRLHAGDEPLPVGVGVNFGVARVGNVGAGDVKDFTAVGDVVNNRSPAPRVCKAGPVV
jgi:adenylate cyclase